MRLSVSWLPLQTRSSFRFSVNCGLCVFSPSCGVIALKISKRFYSLALRAWFSWEVLLFARESILPILSRCSENVALWSVLWIWDPTSVLCFQMFIEKFVFSGPLDLSLATQNTVTAKKWHLHPWGKQRTFVPNDANERPSTTCRYLLNARGSLFSFS